MIDPVLRIASERAIFPGPIRPPVSKSMRIDDFWAGEKNKRRPRAYGPCAPRVSQVDLVFFRLYRQAMRVPLARSRRDLGVGSLSPVRSDQRKLL
jgi:hypothetical protein